MEDYKDLSYRIYTSRSESDKAINSLKGILTGIGIDGQVNDIELAELAKWCQLHHDLIDRNPFREFMSHIRELSKAKEGREEIVEDLFWLCQKYENEDFYYDALTSDLQSLQGVCHGILADGIITDKEIFSLSKWLDQHKHLNTYYPYDEINSLVLSIISDGKVTEDERKRLKAFFNEFIKISYKRTQTEILEDIKEINISGICTSEPKIIIDGRVFCFTGLSKRGTRKEIEDRIVSFGGTFINSISGKTNYLIVGDNDNPCWAFACYGRKVEKAMSLRKQGHNITIIHEFDFWDYLDDLG